MKLTVLISAVLLSASLTGCAIGGGSSDLVPEGWDD